MAFTITHNSVVVTADDPDYEVGSDEWNANHTISGSVAYSELTGNPTSIAASSTLSAVIFAVTSTSTASTASIISSTSPTSAYTLTLPNATTTFAALAIADQTLSGGANCTTFDNGTKSSGTFTVDCGKNPCQKCVNGGAFTLAAPASDGSCILLVTNNGSAGAITFSGFSVGSNTGDALTTTDTNKFSIHIWSVGGIPGYRIAAHQ